MGITSRRIKGIKMQRHYCAHETPRRPIQEATANELYRACQVIRLTPQTKKWLEENDPKALEQLEAAVQRYQNINPEAK